MRSTIEFDPPLSACPASSLRLMGIKARGFQDMWTRFGCRPVTAGPGLVERSTGARRHPPNDRRSVHDVLAGTGIRLADVQDVARGAASALTSRAAREGQACLEPGRRRLGAQACRTGAIHAQPPLARVLWQAVWAVLKIGELGSTPPFAPYPWLTPPFEKVGSG